MNLERRRQITTRFLLSVWGLFTLVLLFCVALLVREMIEAGGDPLAAIRLAGEKKSKKSPASGVAMPKVNRDFQLFFSAPDATGLLPETRSLAFAETTLENCRTALEGLIAGPRERLAPIMPASVSLRGLYLLDNGDLVIDFSREMKTEHLRFKSASLESILVQGVAHTVSQPALRGSGGATVRRVRFLFDGSPQDTFPAHIALLDPIQADERWLAPLAEDGLT